MTRARLKVLWIHGYQVVPEKLAIFGPHGKLVLQADAMSVLLCLADHSKTIVDRSELLNCLGDRSGGESTNLERLIAELRECFDDHQDNPLFIQGSAETGYRLNAAAVSGDEVTVRLSDGMLVRPNDELVEKIQHITERFEHSSSQPDSVVLDLSSPQDTSLWQSLSRRRVFRVMGSYAVGSWLLIQISDVLSGAFPIPDWTTAATALALAVGFPITAALTWAFQMTPDGIALDIHASDEELVDRTRLLRFIDLVIIGVLIVVVAVLSYGKFFPFLPENSRIKIAVLPFETLGAESEVRYLSEGITDDIRSRLYDIPQFLIAARTSTNALSDKGLDIKSIGEHLAVQHVLDGSVRRVKDRMRVTVQLVDVSTGFNRWSKTYNTTIEDLLDVQSNISLFVAGELEVLLTKELRKTLAEKPTSNPAAYDLYLQARSYLNRPSSTGALDAALILFRKSIDEDPLFALGYAGLCQTYLARYLSTGDTAFVAAAEKNCEIALAYDAGLSEVHTALGRLYVAIGRLDDAQASYENALQLDANSIGAITGLGDVYEARGDYMEAEKQYIGAIGQRPGNWNSYNILAHFLLKRGRFAEAVENYERVLGFEPDNAHALSNLGATYYLLGKFEHAAIYYKRSLDLNPGRAAYSNTGTMHYYAGDYEQAVELFQKAAEEAGNDYRLWGNLADAQRLLKPLAATAQETYKKAIKLALIQLDVNPNDVPTIVNLAFYYANTGEAQEAKARLIQVDGSAQQDAKQEYTKALTYALLDQPDKSKVLLANAVKLGFPQSIIDVTPELQSRLQLKPKINN